MVDSADHVTGKTGLSSPDSITLTVSKAGGSFAAVGGAIAEVANGWYKVSLTTTDTNTLGDLAFHATATGCDPTDWCDQVTAQILGDTLTANATQINSVSASSVTAINANLGTTQPVNFTGTGASALAKSDIVDIAGSAVSTSSAQIGVNVVNAGGTAWASGSLTSGVFASGAITATAIAADAIGASELATDAVSEIANAVWDLDATTHQTQGTFGQVLGDSGSDSDSVWSLVNANLDATVSSRLASSSITLSGGAVTVGTNNDKTGYALTSGERNSVADAMLDRTAGIETSVTPRQGWRIMLAALAGKASGLSTTTAVYRDTNDSVDRITATVDSSGNRSAVTLDAS